MNPIPTNFKKIDPEAIRDNFIQTIGSEWMLITAGTVEKYNTMTASWGAMGTLWNKPVAICFIRPVRFTYHFANENDVFTLSFFTQEENKILTYCGTNSGKHVDKITKTGLSPIVLKNNGISFEQSRLIIECRKIYFDDLKPEHFLLTDTDLQHYPNKDYHRFFIGEILACYEK